MHSRGEQSKDSEESAVSELIGAVLLISLSVIAISIVGTQLLSQPQPEKIPALNAIISNESRTVNVYHNGGDPLYRGEFRILVDGSDYTSNFTITGNVSQWSSWSIGQTLTYTLPEWSPLPQNVALVYTGPTGSGGVMMASTAFTASWSGGAGQSNQTPPAAPFTITASAGPGGSLNPSGSVYVPAGQSRTFTITPSGGYSIQNVIVDGSSVGAVTSYTFNNVQSDHAISATFYMSGSTLYSITSTAGSGGSISPSGTVVIPSGGNQIFTIAPDSGYLILNVLVDSVSIGSVSSYTFVNLNANHTIYSDFALTNATSYTITSSASAGGSISPQGTVSVVAGATQAFTITPAPSYIITDVTVDGSSVGAVPTYSFTNVSASHTISASFATGSYTITASAGTGGTITPNGTISVPYGGSQTFVIIPNTGYRIDYVVVNGSSQGPISSYQFPNVTTSHTISAAFAVNTTTVTATAGTGGSISPSGPVTINYGASQIFSITPNTNYAILNIIVDGVPRGPNTTYTFTNSDPVTLTHTIQATFTATSYDMILTAPKQGYLAFNTDVRFTVVGTGSSIRLGNNNTNLNNGDTVQLILRGTNTTNYGSIWIYGGTINRFNYANVAFYRNGVYQRKNTVTAIFIGGFTNYISSLMLEVPAASAGTSLTANGQTIISGTNSSRIRIYNLKPDSTGLFDLGNSATDVDYTGGANSYTVG